MLLGEPSLYNGELVALFFLYVGWLAPAREGGGGLLHAFGVKSLTTDPREDEALFLQERPPMVADRSFLLGQIWIKEMRGGGGHYKC